MTQIVGFWQATQLLDFCEQSNCRIFACSVIRKLVSDEILSGHRADSEIRQ
jgi:hypothetical protein